jgi:hypothetical protein
MLITASKSARHLSLSWASSIQSIPPHPTSWRSILILSAHARVSKEISFSQVSPPKPWIRHSYPPYALHAPSVSFFSILSPEKYWVNNTEYSMLLHNKSYHQNTNAATQK